MPTKNLLTEYKDELNDLGEERDLPEVDTEPKRTPKDEKHYPSDWLETDQYPGLDGVEVGDTITVLYVGKVVGVDINEDDGGKRMTVRVEKRQGMASLLDSTNDMELNEKEVDGDEIDKMLDKKDRDYMDDILED